MLKSNTNATIESCLAYGKLSNYGREIARNQAARLDDAIDYWGANRGQRNQVRVAINRDFNGPTCVNTPLSGQVLSGWYAKRFWDSGGDSGFGWTTNRVAFIGDCVYHQTGRQFVTYANTGVPGVAGLHNIGLVVRIAGKVDYRSAAPYYFYIDDGSGLASDGHKGMRVESDSFTPPSAAYAAVSGVVTSKSIDGVIVPVIVVREAADIVGF